MRSQLDNVAQEFIFSNEKIVHGYFSFLDKFLDSLGASDSTNESVLTHLLVQTETVMTHYLSAHQKVVESVYAYRVSDPVNPIVTVPKPVYSGTPGPASATVAELTPALSYRQWLRAEISSATGFEEQQIDFDKSFESLGIHSLVLIDILDSLSRHFPQTKTLTSQLFDAPTPSALLVRLEAKPAARGLDVDAWVLEELSKITGFNVDQIDQTQSYESLGLDSLVRLDFLESIIAAWPLLKPSSTELASATFPQETIVLIKTALAVPESTFVAARDVQLPELRRSEEQVRDLLFSSLSPLISEASISVDIDTPFVQLGLNGLDRETLCQSMSQQCSASELAGEALMSCRTPKEMLSLLARLG